MLRQILQWFRGFLQQLLGRGNYTTSSLNSQEVKEETQQQNLSLTDMDYEFLFNQLLEGVAHGWNQVQIVKFFERLDKQSSQEQWKSWLLQFGAKNLASPTPNQQLGKQLVQLSERMQSLASLRQFQTTAYALGQQILNLNSDSAVWEYVGPDAGIIKKPNSSIQKEVQVEEIKPLPVASNQDSQSDIFLSSDIEELELEKSLQINTQADTQLEPQFQSILPLPSQSEDIDLVQIVTPETKVENNVANQSPPQNVEETITLDEFLVKLKQDPHLVQLIAKELGIETNEPQVIIDTLINQLNQVKNPKRKTPDNFEGWFNLGLQQADAGDFDSAIASWDNAIKLKPDLSQAWHNRGSALGHLGQLEEAITSFDKALEIKPSDYQAWNDRGNALYNLKRWEEAVSSWDKALEIKTDYYQAWYNRGSALEKLERLHESIISYNQSLKIKPDFQPAQYKLSQLQEQIDNNNQSTIE